MKSESYYGKHDDYGRIVRSMTPSTKNLLLWMLLMKREHDGTMGKRRNKWMADRCDEPVQVYLNNCLRKKRNKGLE